MVVGGCSVVSAGAIGQVSKVGRDCRQRRLYLTAAAAAIGEVMVVSAGGGGELLVASCCW